MMNNYWQVPEEKIWKLNYLNEKIWDHKGIKRFRFLQMFEVFELYYLSKPYKKLLFYPNNFKYIYENRALFKNI